MKKITILGSTGSIGTQGLDVIEKNPELFRVSGLTCGINLELFRKQLRIHRPAFAAVKCQEDAKILSAEFPHIDFSFGLTGITHVAKESDSQLVLNALSGMMGLTPTYHAMLAGKQIALANKETLVAGGSVIMPLAASMGLPILPVDSEHSAIFQCLQGNAQNELHKILLTASGGPFLGYDLQQLERVTPEQALKHPNWTMGNKITIDSATLMNKGLEVIEAGWLFHAQPSQIQVVVHPQSIIHSMVEFKDHAIMAQLGLPDMRGPIGYAFSYPNRLANEEKSVDFFRLGNLSFEPPRMETFRCLHMAYETMEAGGSYPVVLNAANEVLVGLFLQKRIGFLDIQRTIERVLSSHVPVYRLTLDSILELDRETRESVLGD